MKNVVVIVCHYNRIVIIVVMIFFLHDSSFNVLYFVRSFVNKPKQCILKKN